MKLIELRKARPEWFHAATTRHFLNRKNREAEFWRAHQARHRDSLTKPWFDGEK